MQNSFVNQHFVRFVRISYGALANKDINVIVSVICNNNFRSDENVIVDLLGLMHPNPTEYLWFYIYEESLSKLSMCNIKCFALYDFILNCFLACQTAVHKKCHEKLLGTCSESSFNSESTIVSKRITNKYFQKVSMLDALLRCAPSWRKICQLVFDYSLMISFFHFGAILVLKGTIQNRSTASISCAYIHVSHVLWSLWLIALWNISSRIEMWR